MFVFCLLREIESNCFVITNMLLVLGEIIGPSNLSTSAEQKTQVCYV